jgi:hypothetical protein
MLNQPWIINHSNNKPLTQLELVLTLNLLVIKNIIHTLKNYIM